MWTYSMNLINILSSIKEPLLLAFGILSGVLIHMIKCRLDERSEIKKRTRQLTIDSAERIKAEILEIDKIIDNINFDEPDIENQNHLYVEIENNMKKIHAIQREIIDDRLQLLIVDFTSTFALIRMAHWLEGKLDSSQLMEYKTKFFGVTSDEDFHNETSYLYYNSFEKLMRYISTEI